MWEVLVHLAEPVLRVFGLVWTEDDRPAARWFAVGCLGATLALIGLLVWRVVR